MTEIRSLDRSSPPPAFDEVVGRPLEDFFDPAIVSLLEADGKFDSITGGVIKNSQYCFFVMMRCLYWVTRYRELASDKKQENEQPPASRPTYTMGNDRR